MAGDPSFSPRWLERALAERLGPFGPEVGRPVRLVRWDGRKAVVEVPHRLAATARGRYAEPWSADGRTVHLVPVRTWGTLRGAKEWMRIRGTDR